MAHSPLLVAQMFLNARHPFNGAIELGQGGVDPYGLLFVLSVVAACSPGASRLLIPSPRERQRTRGLLKATKLSSLCIRSSRPIDRNRSARESKSP